MARRMYHGTLANVSFDSEVCQHAAECVHGMPSVFNTGKKPWIDPETLSSNADRQQLADVIARCPSGALHFHPAGTTAP